MTASTKLSLAPSNLNKERRRRLLHALPGQCAHHCQDDGRARQGPRDGAAARGHERGGEAPLPLFMRKPQLYLPKFTPML